jgi:dephospho-CoA kinase
MVVGITGEIGAGKSTLATIFRDWGAKLISGDEIGWELLRREEPTYRVLLEKYGRDILNAEGEIDRRKLGGIVFSSPIKTREFNALVHPELLKRLKRRIEETKRTDSLVVVDAALIVEWGITDEFDKLIVVIADEERRIERLKRSAQLNDAELRDRFRIQLPREEKIGCADWVIENNGDLRELSDEAEKIWRELSKWRERRS